MLVIMYPLGVEFIASETYHCVLLISFLDNDTLYVVKIHS